MPGLVWHITHRYHRQQFLLKFQRDRTHWRRWLFEGRKRYALCILSYIATSNHVHLLVLDTGSNEIPTAMQLIAGRTAQAHNQRKSRKGAFWEDRYHATAVETGKHLARCLVYVDLNMVRAGVVRHPEQWGVSGNLEIPAPPTRYRIVDREALARTPDLPSAQVLADQHKQWVDETLADDRCSRDDRWTRAVGVGSEAFVAQLKEQLGLRAIDRTVTVDNDVAFLAEDPAPYGPIWPPKSSF